MFDNIGNKIKMLAKIEFYILCVLSVIGGLVFFKSSVLLGLVIIIAGVFFSWVAVIALYAFGQLVENSDKIANGTNNVVQQANVNETNDMLKQANEIVTCPNCGKENKKGATFCAGCGTKLS